MACFICYHGTKFKDAMDINKDNFQVYNKTGWLGKGVYFFEEDLQLSLDWANYKFPKENIKAIRCEIEVPNEEIFDVTDPKSNDAKRFHAIRKALIEQIFKSKLNVIAANKEDLDGKIYDLICNKDGFKLVRANTYTYIKEDREYGLFSRVPNGIELCLKAKGLGYIINKQLV